MYTKRYMRFKIIFIILCSIFLVSTVVYAKTEIKFEDIENHWAKEEINYLIQNEVVNGYDDYTFRPNQTVRISEFLKILIELGNYPLEIKKTIWPDAYIATAKKQNLIQEDEFDDFSRNITRYEVVNILGRYLELEDLKVAKNSFLDLENKYKNQVLKLVSLKIMNGYSDNTFRGEKFVTRAEVCKMVKNAYEAKQKLFRNRKYEITSENTNLKNLEKKNERLENRNCYEIKANRLYFYDSGRYGNLNAQTLNQEYISDKKVISIIEALVDNDSYTEVSFIPDKYIVNSLNISYGRTANSLLQGAYYFQIKFYENAYYDVAKSKNEEIFMKDAMIKIKLGKLWEQLTELDSKEVMSERNQIKLEKVIGVLFGEEYKKEIMQYIIEKRIEAGSISNSDIPKILEVKKFGKYKINIWCMENQELEIFIQKF